MEYTYKYPRPAVTADCVVMTREKDARVLLVKRGRDPFKGMWALPGGFMEMDETTEECAIRELQEETGLKVDEVFQVGAYSALDRDPRHRTVSVAYIALVDKERPVKGQDDADKAEWWSIDSLPDLAFDHEEILQDALEIYESILEDE